VRTAEVQQHAVAPGDGHRFDACHYRAAAAHRWSSGLAHTA
jgi:hypothetical protein